MPDADTHAAAPARTDPESLRDAPIAFVLNVLQALSEMASLDGETDPAAPADPRSVSAQGPRSDPLASAPLTLSVPSEPVAQAISCRQAISIAEEARLPGGAAKASLPLDSSWSSWSVVALERAVARLGIAVTCLVAPPDRFH